jgi:hypothetical protein
VPRSEESGAVAINLEDVGLIDGDAVNHRSQRRRTQKLSGLRPGMGQSRAVGQMKRHQSEPGA